MRKIFSSVCLALILLNVMGYYGVLMGLQSRHTTELTQQFDAGVYDKTQALAIKIPAKASQNYQSGEFRRVDGEFEKKGSVYRLIKQRVYMDTFHIIYIKDIRGTAINLALKDYAKSFGEPPPLDDGQQQYIVPLFMKEYCARSFIIEQRNSGWMHTVAHRSETKTFIPSYSPSIVHPPERLV